MADQQPQPMRVFYSYSHKDAALREELETHLAALKRGGAIQEWSDRDITGGQEWAGQIDQNLEAADIILLLVSADFIASDYCYDKEMTRALEKHATGAARVIPIILRPVDWESTPFNKLQAFPTAAKAVTTWPNRDEAWVDVVRGIRKAIRLLSGAGGASEIGSTLHRTSIGARPAPVVGPEDEWARDVTSIQPYRETAPLASLKLGRSLIMK